MTAEQVYGILCAQIPGEVIEGVSNPRAFEKFCCVVAEIHEKAMRISKQDLIDTAQQTYEIMNRFEAAATEFLQAMNEGETKDGMTVDFTELFGPVRCHHPAYAMFLAGIAMLGYHACRQAVTEKKVYRVHEIDATA